MRISDWSSDVCSSDLLREPVRFAGAMASMPDAAVVEISPHPILAVSVGQGLAALGRGGPVLSTLRRDETAANCLRELLDSPASAGIATAPEPPERPGHVLAFSARRPADLAALAGPCY